MASDQNIQIKIALSVDKVHILIKILAESHIAFDLEIKSPSLTRTLGRRNIKFCKDKKKKEKRSNF